MQNRPPDFLPQINDRQSRLIHFTRLGFPPSPLRSLSRTNAEVRRQCPRCPAFRPPVPPPPPPPPPRRHSAENRGGPLRSPSPRHPNSAKVGGANSKPRPERGGAAYRTLPPPPPPLPWAGPSPAEPRRRRRRRGEPARTAGAGRCQVRAPPPGPRGTPPLPSPRCAPGAAGSPPPPPPPPSRRRRRPPSRARAPINRRASRTIFPR